MNETPSETTPVEPPPLPPENEVLSKYQGVKGWLFFFCLILTVLGPLVTIASLIKGFGISEEALKEFPGLLVMLIIDAVLSLGIAGFGMYAGIKLWRIRPGAVLAAKQFLYCTLAYHAIGMGLPWISGLPAEDIKAMVVESVRDVMRGLIHFAIWFSYLNKSKRVRATYTS